MSGTLAVDWESRYREGITGWERPAPNPGFLAWRLSGELAPCRILVPGGGRSLEPLALAEAGFQVTVVDAAPSAVAVQQARLAQFAPASGALLADLFAWQPDAPFDAVYDQTCLCALPPALWPDYVQRLHDWLRPNAALFIMFMQTGTAGGPPFHCDIDNMRQLFAPPGWIWPQALLPLIHHPSGRSEQPVVLRRD